MSDNDDLHIWVMEARHVASMDKSGTSDPYVIAKTSFSSQKFKTKVLLKNLTPNWNQEFIFFTNKPEGQLHLQMYDFNKIYKHEFMGEVKVNLADFGDGKVHDKWFPLENEPTKKKVDKATGELRLKIHFAGIKPKSDKPEEKSTSTTDVKTGGASTTPDRPPIHTNINIEDRYEMGKIIGRGAFSVVKVGVGKTDRKKHAVKCISKKLIDKKEMTLLEREIDIMRKLRHENIIQMTEVIDTPETLYLVLEFASGGELFDAIVNRGSYSEADAARLIRQILEAILYIHQHGIAHRDLKPENLLLANEKGQTEHIKIADFGLSKEFGVEQMATSCGTPDYVAPEVLSGEVYDKEVDIWSIGVITYVLLCGFPPFYGETQKELFENIMAGNYDFPNPEWSGVSSDAKAFIKKMLVVDPEKRYTAEQCLKDKWLLDFAAPKKEVKRLETFSVARFKEYTQKYKEQNPRNTGAD